MKSRSNKPTAIQAALGIFAKSYEEAIRNKSSEQHNNVRDLSELYVRSAPRVNLASRIFYRHQAQLRLAIKELEVEYQLELDKLTHDQAASINEQNKIIAILMQVSEKYLELAHQLSEQHRAAPSERINLKESLIKAKLPKHCLTLDDAAALRIAQQFTLLASDYSFSYLDDRNKSTDELLTAITELKKLAYKCGFNTEKRIKCYLEIASKYCLIALQYREHTNTLVMHSSPYSSHTSSYAILTKELCNNALSKTSI